MRGQTATKNKKPRNAGLSDNKMAVKKGFEPLIQFPVYTLSRRAPSATRTLHRFLAGLFSLPRRANVVESVSDGKGFLHYFHGFMHKRRDAVTRRSAAALYLPVAGGYLRRHIT
jgi:hypothetical protein